MKTAFFASGNASNLEVLLQKIHLKQLDVKPVFILSNNSSSRALALAKQHNITAIHCSEKTQEKEKTTEAILSYLRLYQVDLIVLAGYLKKIPTAIIHHYPNRILNIHPSLLPAFGGQHFYGKKIHESVLQRGCRYTGITIHWVTENYDEGPILFQKILEIEPHETVDSLFIRVLAIEHDSYWKVLQKIVHPPPMM